VVITNDVEAFPLGSSKVLRPQRGRHPGGILADNATLDFGSGAAVRRTTGIEH